MKVRYERDMKFFTDKNWTNGNLWPYLLLKVPQYLKMRDFSNQKEILIDPGVWELIEDHSFSWERDINLHKFLDSLPSNHFLSLDYPSDMNLKYKKLFLEKSQQYSLGFCYHPNFIVTVQFYHNNYWSFRENFDKYNALDITSGFLALGNICKHKTCNEFIKHSLDYAFSHTRYDRMHIYGLCKSAIPYAYKLGKRFKIDLSIDSTKWQYYKKTSERPFIFKQYLNDLRSKGVFIEGTVLLPS